MDPVLVESVRLFSLDECACLREDLRPQFAVWGQKREESLWQYRLAQDVSGIGQRRGRDGL
ncbi:MAG: hypothetical protein MUO35_10010 [Anaerolineales bacterium]|nr:hypothetical protein [Anaerolineales bacterium]